MSAKIIFNKEQEDEIIRLYNEKRSLSNTEKILSISRYYIKIILKRNKIEIYDPINKKKILNEDRIIEEFTKNEKNSREIAREINVSPTTILKILKNNNVNTSRKGKSFSKDHIKNLCIIHKGQKGYWLNKKRSKEDIKKFKDSHLGKKQSEETILKRIRKGKDHYNYQGGITPLTRRRTRGIFWKKIADEIRLRDNNTCKICGLKGGQRLPVHHIIPFKISMDNSPKNLITLCNSCHAKFEKNVKELGYLTLQEKLSKRYGYLYLENVEILKEGIKNAKT